MWDSNFLGKSSRFRQVPAEFTRVCWSSPATSGQGDTVPCVLASMHPMKQLLQHLLWFPRPLDVPSVQQLFQFMNIAFALKKEIILTLPSTHPHKDPPTCLPPTVMQFLAAGCYLTDDKVSDAWTLFKHAVWSGVVPIHSNTSHAFQRLGQQMGVGELDADVVFNDNDPPIQAKFHLFPPHRMCLAPHCTRTKKDVALYHVHQQEVVVFTLKNGPCEAKLFISTAKVSQYMHYLQHTLTDGILCSLFCWLLSQLYCAQTCQWASTAIRDWSPCTPMHLLCSNSGVHSGCRTCIHWVPSCQAFYYLNGAFVVWIAKYSVWVTNVTDQLQQGCQPQTVHGCTTCALERARAPPTTIPFHLSWLLCMFGMRSFYLHCLKIVSAKEHHWRCCTLAIKIPALLLPCKLGTVEYRHMDIMNFNVTIAKSVLRFTMQRTRQVSLPLVLLSHREV